jgi:prenylcysteine oxidase / farnesylcysteine lyase
VEVNEILYNAVERYNLSTKPFRWEDPDDGADELGIWNGREFILTQSGSSGWWDLAKLFWKYGLAPIRANNLMKKTVGNFRKMYHENFPWPSLSDVVHDVGLTFSTGVTGDAFLQENGISAQFSNEVIQAA